MIASTTADPNPYVGPREFRSGEKLYGRDREVRRLTDLLIARRLVLLNSPSGAGKTSLIQASLIPELTAERFTVLGPIRVTFADPALAGVDVSEANRYVLSALQCLETEVPPDRQLPTEELAKLTLPDYLAQRKERMTNGQFEVLVFDQFEELLAASLTHGAAIRAFIAQVSAVLATSDRWALFSIREDFVAALEPYLLPVPTMLRTRFRLDLLDERAALAAVRNPARDHGVEFSEEAARGLIDDLRRSRVQRADGTLEEAQGDWVEPVQLQVVCRRLWERLKPDQRLIDLDDIAALGNVDTVLGDYYADEVAAVAHESGVSEREIRVWFNDRLITKHGMRSQVVWEPPNTGGLSDPVIRELVDTHLIRAEQRRGMTWFELAHDRLIDPVRQNNEEWFEREIAYRAEQFFTSLSPDEQGIAQDLFTRLVRLDDSPAAAAQDSARVTLLTDLTATGEVDPGTRQMIERLTEIGIISLRGDFAELGEPALVRDWTRLRAWLDDDRAELLIRQEMSDAAHKWAEAERDEAFLAHLASPRFETAEQLARRGHPPLNTLERAYLAASVETRQRRSAEEEARRQREIDAARQLAAEADLRQRAEAQARHEAERRATEQAIASHGLRQRLLIAAALAVVAVIAAAIAIIASREASTERSLAERSANLDRTRALAARAERLGQVGDVTQGALLAREAYRLDRELDGELWSDVDAALRLTIEHSVFSTVLPGTPYWVGALAFHPDGHRLVAGGASSTLKIWDISRSVQEPIATTRLSSWISSVAISPDGNLLVAGTGDGNIHLFDPDDLEQTRTSLRSDGGRVKSVAFSPDGATIASGGCGSWNNENANCDVGVVRIWDPKQPASPIREWRVPETEIRAVAFAPDGMSLAAGGCGREMPGSGYCLPDPSPIRIWELDDPSQEPAILNGHGGAINVLVYSPDGADLVSGSDDASIRIWNARNRETLPRVLGGHDEAVRSISFTADGDYVASGGQDETVRIWDRRNDYAIVHVLGGSEDWVRSVAFSPNGATLASASNSGQVRLWRLPDPELGIVAPRLLGGHQRGNGHEDWVFALAFSPDGTLLASASDDATIRLWPLGQAQDVPIVLRGHTSRVNSVAFSSDGLLLASVGNDQTIRIWSRDAAGGWHESNVLQTPGRVARSVAFSPDNSWLATGSSDGLVQLRAVANVEAPPVELKSPSGIAAIAFSPSGALLAAADYTSTIRVWRVNELETPPRELVGHEAGSTSVAFSRDGRRLATGSRDQTVRVWDTGDWDKDPLVLRGHDGEVRSVAFAADGSFLASGSTDTTVRLWDLNRPAAFPSVIAHGEEWVRAVAFSPDGKTLASASADGKVRLSIANTADLAEAVCANVDRNLTTDEWIQYLGPHDAYQATCPQLPPGGTVTP